MTLWGAGQEVTGCKKKQGQKRGETGTLTLDSDPGQAVCLQVCTDRTGLLVLVLLRSCT